MPANCLLAFEQSERIFALTRATESYFEASIRLVYCTVGLVSSLEYLIDTCPPSTRTGSSCGGERERDPFIRNAVADDDEGNSRND